MPGPVPSKEALRSMPSKMIGLPSLSRHSCGGGTSPTSFAKVGHQSICDHISILVVPALIFPGTRRSPEPGSPPRTTCLSYHETAYRPASGKASSQAPVVGGPDDQGVVGNPKIPDRLDDLTCIVVKLHQRIEIIAGRPATCPRQRGDGLFGLCTFWKFRYMKNGLTGTASVPLATDRTPWSVRPACFLHPVDGGRS